ncbi:MAG: TIGR01777 family protein [Planctomycetes bacterium]|nr:TIGR01777 family protein [Planctomycetota bacterium]
MRVFLTGGTGLVGSLLVKRLTERGDHVDLLTRRPEAAKHLEGERCTIVAGDPVQPGPWMDVVASCDAVVNLAGEGIFNRRWGAEFKDLIRSSRVKSTENVVAALAKPGAQGHASPQRQRPAALISGSAIGYYGPHGDEEITEESLAGNDFLASVCADWENAALAASAHGVRVVLLRTGIVLDRAGPLAKMLTPFKMFVGGPLAGGRQFMSWIHNEDEVGLILHALDHAEIVGPLNATAPNALTNREFSRTLGKVLGRPSFLPTPGFALRVMLGEGAQIITTGQRVLPRRALGTGYAFKFPELETALRDILSK